VLPTAVFKLSFIYDGLVPVQELFSSKLTLYIVLFTALMSCKHFYAGKIRMVGKIAFFVKVIGIPPAILLAIIRHLQS